MGQHNNNTNNNNFEPNEASRVKLIGQVRDRIVRNHVADQVAYDERDVQLLRRADWFVERYLRRQRYHLEPAVKMLDAALRWRNELGIAQRTDLSVPREFFRLGGIFVYGHDRQGDVVVHARGKRNRPLKEFMREANLFLIHQLDKASLVAEDRAVAIVFDCADMGLANCSLEQFRFILDSYLLYQSCHLKHVLVVNLPWLLSPVARLVVSWLPEEFSNLVKVVGTPDELADYIDPSELPPYLGGTCTRNYMHIPEGCRSFHEGGFDTQLSLKQMQDIYKCYEKNFAECDQELWQYFGETYSEML